MTSICAIDGGGAAALPRITCITLDFVHGLDPDHRITLEDALKCDWKTFDEHLAQLADIQKVVFGFQSKMDLGRFQELVIAPNMPLMSSNIKLKVVLAVWKHQPELNMLEGTWQYALPEIEDMEGANSVFLCALRFLLLTHSADSKEEFLDEL